MSLLSQGGFGCVYYPGIKCDGTIQQNKNYITKIQKKTFNAKNEINIGHIISKIDNYFQYFSPIFTNCPINVRTINNKILSKCEIISKKNKFNYILMDMIYIQNKHFYEFFLENIYKKNILSCMNNSYLYLINSVKILNNNNIIHYDLKADNIIYNIKTNNPLIIDYGISIPLSILNKNNIRNYFYIYAPEYYTWTLDIHVINFLLHETDLSLTDKDIKKISYKFTTRNKALDIFSLKFKTRFYNDCCKELVQYIGQPPISVINKLLLLYKTWDIYSLSVI